MPSTNKMRRHIFHRRIFVASANREWYFHFGWMNWIRLSTWIFQFTRHSFELFAVCMIICTVSVYYRLTFVTHPPARLPSPSIKWNEKYHPTNLRQYFEIDVFSVLPTPLPLHRPPPPPLWMNSFSVGFWDYEWQNNIVKQNDLNGHKKATEWAMASVSVCMSFIKW